MISLPVDSFRRWMSFGGPYNYFGTMRNETLGKFVGRSRSEEITQTPNLVVAPKRPLVVTDYLV